MYSVCCCLLMLPISFPLIFLNYPELHLVSYFIYYLYFVSSQFPWFIPTYFLTFLSTVIFFPLFIYLQVSFFEKLNTVALCKPIQITLPVSRSPANSKSDAGFHNVKRVECVVYINFSQFIVSNLLNRPNHSNNLSLSKYLNQSSTAFYYLCTLH